MNSIIQTHIADLENCTGSTQQLFSSFQTLLNFIHVICCRYKEKCIRTDNSHLTVPLANKLEASKSLGTFQHCFHAPYNIKEIIAEEKEKEKEKVIPICIQNPPPLACLNRTDLYIIKEINLTGGPLQGKNTGFILYLE